MSFFDEADEPPRREPRSRPRAGTRVGARQRRPSGPGRRPPGGSDQQNVQIRRAVALGLLLVVIVVIALGVHSCAVSADNSALQDYTSQVSSLVTRSNANGSALFTALSNATGPAGETTVQTAVNGAHSTAATLLHTAQQLSVPSQMHSANTYLLLVLRMRRDGISGIANEIQPALSGGSTSAGAVQTITMDMSFFYGSDAVYKGYVAPEIYRAMHAAGVRFSGLPMGQFLPSLDWLARSFIASELHVTLPGTKPAKLAPGSHGHELDSVSVAGTTLDPSSTNTASSKQPTFTLHFKNSGQNTETGVVCKVSVNGTSIAGTATVPQTQAGSSYTCDVKLPSPAPAGTQTITAQVEKVRGEHDVANNSKTYTVTFP
ncbi:MAG: CARDB domain-containing protein [Solirubrobacteraceae bacterium]